MHNAIFTRPGTIFTRPGTMLFEIGDVRNPAGFHAMQTMANTVAEARAARLSFSGTGNIFDSHVVERGLGDFMARR